MDLQLPFEFLPTQPVVYATSSLFFPCVVVMCVIGVEWTHMNSAYSFSDISVLSAKS